MKIKIELELQPEDVPLANELLSTLRALTDHVNAPPPVVKKTGELLDDLIKQLGDEATRSSAGSSILSMLNDPSYGPADKLVGELAEAYQKTIFAQEFLASGRPVVPYLEYLRGLRDGDMKGKVRDVLVAKIVPQLAKKRGPNADRKDFFVYAEAFAFFAAIELMSLEGAMTTMGKLLLRPETRAAAITMLGKTAEICADLVLSKCKPEVVANVHKQLQSVTEECYAYDVNFICTAFKWPAPMNKANGTAPGMMAPASSQASAAPRQQPPQQQQQRPAAPPSSMPVPTPAPAAAPQQAPSNMPMPMPVMDSAPPTTGPAAQQGAGGGKMSLRQATVLAGGHATQPYYICHDSSMDRLVSGGKDGDFTVWDASGRIMQRVQTPMYICGMDLAPSQGLLYMCAFSQEAGTLNMPCLNVYATGEQYSYKATMLKADCMLMASVQSLGPDSFMVAESISQPSGQPKEVVALYDAERSVASGQLAPLASFSEHVDIVTCMAGSASNPNICFTGSKDALIKLWDKRQRNGKSVGTFASDLSHAASPSANHAMVTCLDNVDTLLISTSTDNSMHFWDMRALSVSPQACLPVGVLNLGATSAVKVRASGCPVASRAAISTFGAVHLVDYSNLAAPVVSAPCVQYQDITGWIELRWVNGRLHVAGNENLDVFDLV